MLNAFVEQQGGGEGIVAKDYVARDDILRLFSQAPINDALLDGWRDTFRKRIIEAHNLAADILPIFFYNQLAPLAPPYDFTMYNYTNVRRYTISLGDIFALNRLFIPLFVALDVYASATALAFVMIDMNAHSLTYYDPFLRASNNAVMKILKNLHRWLGDEHLNKKGVAIDLSTWSLVSRPIGLPQIVTQITDYDDDGVFVMKAIECLSRGEPLSPLSFTDAMMPGLRRTIALEILTGELAWDRVRRRARVNVLVLMVAGKLSVMAIRARKRAWEPESVNVAALRANFFAKAGPALFSPLLP